MNKSGSWILFIIAAIVLIFLLGLHMIIIHLDGIFGIFNPAGGSALDWGNVIQRSHSNFFMVTYIILLAAALYHGFYGLRTIIFELGPRKQVEQAWTIFIWIVGIVLFIIGTSATIAVQTIETAL
jgi:succinate dehydrogenase / fumarate reductase membrane anchor subunit